MIPYLEKIFHRKVLEKKFFLVSCATLLWEHWEGAKRHFFEVDQTTLSADKNISWPKIKNRFYRPLTNAINFLQMYLQTLWRKLKYENKWEKITELKTSQKPMF